MPEPADRTAPQLPNAPDTSPDNATNAEASAADYSGRVLGDFELLRLIGTGGMGQVYLARQRSLKRHVAIKILKGELAANTSSLRRFQAEAEAVANITHANIVQVYAIGETDGLHYMALEYVDGRNLRDYIERRGLPDLATSLEIIRQTASALQRAGELGFVHRDIKPENILLSRKGEVKITDFGLSRCFSTEAPLNLTQSGVTMGTPLYMSPEQVRGQTVDPRSDIYSLGVTCYHMLAGEPPFHGATAFDVALQHVQSDARPLGSIRPDLPADLCVIVHRMMAKRPEDRYQSAVEILADLSRFRDGLGLAPMPTGPIPLPNFSANFGSSTHLSPVASGGLSMSSAAGTATAGFAWGRWGLVVLAAVTAGAVGAAVQWRTDRPMNNDTAVSPWTDIDPPPSLVRERELRKRLEDKATKIDAAIEELLELARILIREQRFDDAMKLFADPEELRKLPAFQPGPNIKESIRDRELVVIVSILGRGIVLAFQDKPTQSTEEFLKAVRSYPPILSKDKPDPKVRPIANRGLLEAFFTRSSAGGPWKKSVGDAMDRNAKNLKSPPPAELNRLRLLPVRGGAGKT